MVHIVYIPGLGDGNDVFRKTGLLLWRRKGIKVTHIPMRWSDTQETFEQKMERIRQVIVPYQGYTTILIGESAGGPVAIAAMRRFADAVSRVVTVCGMNQGTGNVNPAVYQKNKAFKEVMQRVDEIIPILTPKEKARMLVLYSTNDFAVRPKDTLIPGVESQDLNVHGHLRTNAFVLFWGYRDLLKKIIS